MFKKSVFLSILICSFARLIAMEGEVHDDSYFGPLLNEAIVNGNLERVKELIAQGANPNLRNSSGESLLQTAWLQFDVKKSSERFAIIKFLLENGVDLKSRKRKDAPTDLMYAAYSLNEDLIWLMLTTIPQEEREKLIHLRDAIITAQLSLKQHQIPKDLRRLITMPVIDSLVTAQMERIRELVNMKLACDTARDLATHRVTNRATAESIANLLDLDDPQSYNRIRAAVRNNVMRILFGEPKEFKGEYTKVIPVDEAFGEWEPGREFEEE